MITKEQALTAQHFHENGCKRTVGPRGGVADKIVVWRRNGRTKTWKTRPKEWVVPVKFGIYGYGTISDIVAASYHVPEDCPLLEKEELELSDEVREALEHREKES